MDLHSGVCVVYGRRKLVRKILSSRIDTPSRAFSSRYLVGGSSAHTVEQQSPSVIPSKGNIELTEEEKKIFSQLRQALAYHNLTTVCRVAGGWVRDKLLGLSTDDIDIAVDNMTGEEFAELIKQYLESEGTTSSRVNVIKTNPEKSKHLATATFRIGPRSIDVNHLRSEEYTTDTRIPTIRIGTPWEDAHRRDLTLNALYYNINDDTIEDFTRRGLDDLKALRARTPLAPYETFIDDPLRVLRTLRFAARFNLAMDPELVEAASNENVKLGLRKKVSRERFGKELEKSLHIHSNAADMLVGLVRFGIDRIIFDCEEEYVATLDAPAGLSPEQRSNMSLILVKRMQSLLVENGVLNTHGSTLTAEKLHPLLLLASFLLPYHGLLHVEKKKRTPLVFRMLAEGVKFPHKESGEVNVVVQNYNKIRDLALHLKRMTENDPNLVNRNTRKSVTPEDALSQTVADPENFDAETLPVEEIEGIDLLKLKTGLLLYEIRNLWEPTYLLCKLLEPLTSKSGDILTEEDFDVFSKWVESNGLKRIWEKPMDLNGHEIMKRFKVQGARVGELMRKQKEWQILNPEASAEDTEAYLTSICE